MDCDIRLDFRISHQPSFLNGFFSDSDRTGMHEASDYFVVNLVSLLLGALVDEFCGLFEAAEARKVST